MTMMKESVGAGSKKKIPHQTRTAKGQAKYVRTSSMKWKYPEAVMRVRMKQLDPWCKHCRHLTDKHNSDWEGPWCAVRGVKTKPRTNVPYTEEANGYPTVPTCAKFNDHEVETS